MAETVNPPPEPPAGWRRRLTSPAAAAVVLALFYAALVLSLREKSATFDEPGHAAAGYVYWKSGDYRVDPENGNLSKRWIALPFLFRDDRFPAADGSRWRLGNSWELSDTWFNDLGNDTRAMLRAGRAFAALTAVALAGVVWFWSRALFGPLGGMISLLACVLSPIVLANGGLMTSDTPAALGFIAAVGAVWATLQRITAVRVLGGAVAIAGLFLAKMSAVLLLPMAAILAAARLIDGRPLPVGRRVVHARGAQAAVLLGVAAGQTLLVVALVWSAYGFRFSAAPDGATSQFARPWPWALGLDRPASMLRQLGLTAVQQERIKPTVAAWGANMDWHPEVLADVERIAAEVLTESQTRELRARMTAAPEAFIPRLIHHARELRLLPESFLYGYAHVWKTSDRLIAYFNGEIRDTGWLAFFPFAFAVKTPLPFLGLIVVAVFALGTAHPAGRRGALYAVLPLLVLLAVYWAAALASHLNIGHRHLLPAYPPLFILAGAAALPFAVGAAQLTAGRRPGWLLRPAVPAMLALLALEVAYRFPNYIAYFNGLVPPSRAYRHLVDSSLDWGQELPAIARYLAARPDEPAHLAFFGVGRPGYHGVRARDIGGYPSLERRRRPPLRIVPGGSAETVDAFLRAHPDFDPEVHFTVSGGEQPSTLVLQRGETLHLRPGLYVISATMLPPIFHGTQGTTWTASQEADYRALREALQPLFSDDAALRRQAIPQRTYREWVRLLEIFYDLRLSRLATYLRSREPNDLINFSVLVYRLSEADLRAALDGPVTAAEPKS